MRVIRQVFCVSGGEIRDESRKRYTFKQETSKKSVYLFIYALCVSLFVRIHGREKRFLH